jgi:tetratricopeptide (TPR) repeat protein
MLRGQVQFFRGDFERALLHLEQAVKLDSESAAACGLLAITYQWLGDWPKYEQTVTELQDLPAHSAEDYLFKGYADFDFAKGSSLLSDAVRLSHSPLARALRAEVRAYQAHEAGDLEASNHSLADIEVAMESLGDNPYVLSSRVFVYWTAAILRREMVKEDNEGIYLQEAERSIKTLLSITTLPTFMLYPFVFFDNTDQESEAFAIAQRCSEQSTAPVFADIFAELLYRRNDYQKALDVLDNRKWKEAGGDQLRAYLLAERYPSDLSRARAAVEEMKELYTSGIAQYAPQQVLRFLGDKEGAVKLSRALRDRGRSLATVNREFVDYYCGNLSDAEFLASIGRSRGKRCNAHFDIALTHLAEGDRTGAREHFAKSAAIRLGLNPNTGWSRTFLVRMDQDPNWPPWIPLKQ